MTSTVAASSTAAKAAMPARRAVSATRAPMASRRHKPRRPARKQYAARASANSSAKLPIKGMKEYPMLFFQRKRRDATLQPPQDLPNIQESELYLRRKAAGGPPLHHPDYLDFSSGYFFSRHS